MKKTIALVGNPNCGKTSIFNLLTGSNQYVGNWPGVTVDKKTGTLISTDNQIIDLPGIYSLYSLTKEEKITTDYLLNNTPDIIINIIDISNFQRNFFLTLQLLSLGIPIIIVANFIDDLQTNNIIVDFSKLQRITGCKVVPVSARKKYNIKKIISVVNEQLIIPQSPDIYPFEITAVLAQLQTFFVSSSSSSFFAEAVFQNEYSICPNKFLTDKNKKIYNFILKDFDEKQRVSLISTYKYEFISDVYTKIFSFPKNNKKYQITDILDKIILNKFLAYPVFIIIISTMFYLTFGKFGSFFENLIEVIYVKFLTPMITNIFININASDTIVDLTCNGVLKGIFSILKFFPKIFILFFCISFLEDSGYMARAAFISDKLLSRIGLSGKSFIPILMGLGCTTTAVMATRTGENSNEQRMTILLLPFVSCSAKITIYALFTDLFFKDYETLIIFSLYIVGLFILVIFALIFKKTILKNTYSPFIMELPPYRLPSITSILKSTWNKSKDFFIKAGTIIFIFSIIIWLLQHFNTSFNLTFNSDDSIFSEFGKTIVPFFTPLGFGFWQASVALISGFITKEAVVSTFGIICSENLLKKLFTPASAYSFMLFCLLYPPCISAYSNISKEMKNIKLTIFSILLQISTAYFISFLFYIIASYIIKQL